MHKQWIQALGLAALTGMAAPTMGIGQNDPAIEMMKAQSKEWCGNTAMMECLGIEATTCRQSMDTSIDTCVERVSKVTTQAFGQCQRNQVSDELGISIERIKACDERHGNKHEQTQSQSPQAAQKKFKKKMEKMAAAAKKAAAGIPKSRVTLPVYPNHEVLAHYPSSSMMLSNEDTFGENPVSVIKLTTSDSPSEVIAFYRDKLSGFDAAGDPEVQYTFAKGGVPGLYEQSPSDRIREIAQKEHVSISTTGGKTHIEIGYRR